MSRMTVAPAAVEIVNCDDSKATTKLVKEAKSRADCESGTLKSGDKLFCTEPMKK